MLHRQGSLSCDSPCCCHELAAVAVTAQAALSAVSKPSNMLNCSIECQYNWHKQASAKSWSYTVVGSGAMFFSVNFSASMVSHNPNTFLVSSISAYLAQTTRCTKHDVWHILCMHCAQNTSVHYLLAETHLLDTDGTLLGQADIRGTFPPCRLGLVVLSCTICQNGAAKTVPLTFMTFDP